jgi:hypothetical protein
MDCYVSGENRRTAPAWIKPLWTPSGRAQPVATRWQVDERRRAPTEGFWGGGYASGSPPTAPRAGLAVRIAQCILALTTGNLLNPVNGQPGCALRAYGGGWITSSLQEFALQNRLGCKPSASTRLPRRCHRVPPQMQKVKPDLAWNLHYGGMQRHGDGRSRRLITRRSQVQILPPLLTEALETGP